MRYWSKSSCTGQRCRTLRLYHPSLHLVKQAILTQPNHPPVKPNRPPGQTKPPLRSKRGRTGQTRPRCDWCWSRCPKPEALRPTPYALRPKRLVLDSSWRQNRYWLRSRTRARTPVPVCVERVRAAATSVCVRSGAPLRGVVAYHCGERVRAPANGARKTRNLTPCTPFPYTQIPSS